MFRPPRRFRFLLAWTFCCLGSLPAAPVRADGPPLTAVFGIAGRYRPGAWCPVTVTVRNPSSEGLAGQVQVLAGADSNRNGGGGNRALGAALFGRPVTVSSGAAPQPFMLYTRGLDPGRDSVTVRLSEGRQRGDGRTLASANTQDTKTSQAITGTPVSDTDLLLVGLGGDPGAFIPLNGRQLGLAHQVGGFAVGGSNPGGQPATVQVAEAAGPDLPDKAAGYGGVDAFLLRSDAPLDALTEAQAEALRGWVAAGGHLVVCGGVDPTRFSSAFYNGLLPAGIGAARPGAVAMPGVGPVGALTLTPKPLPGVRVLASAPDGSPLVVAGPYGAGCVTLTAYDPTSRGFQSSTFDSGALWRTLLTAGPSASAAVLPQVAAREENYHPNYYGGDAQLLSDAVMRGPSLDAPATEVIGLFLLVYLIALVPANYLILKRLDRKELAWVTIPALVLLFAVGTFGVGYAAKGGTVFVNRAAIVETTAGRREAGVYAELGLFSPHRTSYDIALPGANGLAAIPNPGLSFNNFRGGSSADTQDSGLTRFVETPDGTSLLDTSVNMWAMRAFDVQATDDLGGTVDSTLTAQGGSPPNGLGVGPVTGTVTNHLSHTLTGCALLHNGQWQTLGDLAPGASVPVSGTSAVVGPPGSLSGLPFSGRMNGNGGDAQADIHTRMQAALADYARSLGQQNNNQFYNGGQTQAPSVYVPSSGEALLLGWSSDPALAGPVPRIDGHAVHENDISLVIVHLPIKGARIVAAALPPPTPGMVRRFQFPPQQRMASRSAQFGVTARTAPAYKQAMDAHSLMLARKNIGKQSSFHGTVANVTQDAQGQTLTVEFDPQYRLAVTAVLTFRAYSRFPNMQTLRGREVVVSGPLLQYGDKIAVMLTRPSQIQVVH